MKKTTCFIMICFFSCFKNVSAKPPFPLTGFGLSLHAGLSKTHIERYLDEIKALGSTTVLYKFSEFQHNQISSVIFPDPEQTIALNTLREAIHMAHKRTLSVVLLPVVLLKTPRSDAEWRGNLKPKNKKEWFENYQNFIEKYARLANETQVEIFSVGSELSSQETEVDFWIETLKKIKTIYKGKLTYSFNWDHLSYTTAWTQLDVLGLSAYYEFNIPKNTKPTLSMLLTQWETTKKTILQWAKHYQKNILFTEVGYPSRENGLKNPWDHTITTEPFNGEIQALGFEAFIQAWQSEPKTHGALFYEWADPKGPQDLTHTPKGKNKVF